MARKAANQWNRLARKAANQSHKLLNQELPLIVRGALLQYQTPVLELTSLLQSHNSNIITRRSLNQFQKKGGNLRSGIWYIDSMHKQKIYHLFFLSYFRLFFYLSIIIINLLSHHPIFSSLLLAISTLAA